MPPPGSAATDVDTDLLFAGRGCCLLMPSLRRRQRWTTAKEEEEWRLCWWWLRASQGWKALGKLKAFLRRLRSRRGGGGGGGGFRRGKFNYDPLSYALNFDEGAGKNRSLDEDGLCRDFSARYASIPASLKLSMDVATDRPVFG